VDKNNKTALTIVLLVIAAISVYALVFIQHM